MNARRWKRKVSASASRRARELLTPALVAASLLIACTAGVRAPPPAEPAPRPIVLRVLYTNDEHGWMEGVAPGRGAAELASLWAAERKRAPWPLVNAGRKKKRAASHSAARAPVAR